MWIKPFLVTGHPYIYSAWTNQIARVSLRLYELFEGGASSDIKRRAAVRLGLLPEEGPELEVLPDTMIDRALHELTRTGPAHMVLTITEACNFRCRYCAYSGAYRHARQHSSRGMSLETATKAVCWYLGFQRDHFHVGFYGGEPLLKLPLVEKVVAEARERLPNGAALTLGMTTNGWLLDEEAIEFLATNGFELYISLDGPSSVHDRYRRTVKNGPTFSRVFDRVVRLARRYPDYFNRHVNFSITLAPPDAVSDVADFIEQNFDMFAAKVPKLGVLNNSASVVLEWLGVAPMRSAIDLTPLRERYLADMVDGSPPNGLGRACTEADMAKIHRRTMVPVATLKSSVGQCIPGTRCHIMPDGRLHMCERGDEHFPIGHVDTGLNNAAIREILRRFRGLVQSQCQDCWAVRLCSKCIPHVAEGDTLSGDRLRALCAARRKSIEKDLTDYCRARAQNNQCFASLANPEDRKRLAALT